MDNLTEKDVNCIARLLQGSIFEKNIFYGCQYCKYGKECVESQKKERLMHVDIVRKKLQQITGVNMDYQYNPDNPLKKFTYQN